VVDFGLGKLTEGNRLSTGNRLGGMCTVYYAAPEQLERKPVDDRTDVYALALIILELLTGLYGFSEKRGELPAREIAQANQLFAQPNSLRGVLPAWLESLAALIEAALSKDKEKRPHSTEMLAGLLAARRTLRAMSRKRGVVVEDEDSADEDSADQPTPAPAAVPAKPAHTTSDIRLIPVLRTETLPPEQPPPDPTAAGNPAPAPVRTIKMARPVEAEFEAARRAKEAAEAAAAAAARAPESTSPGRSATLPPESSAAALPPQSEPVQRTIMTPYPHHPPPQVHHDAAARASLELASRPTVPWKRPEPAREAAASPTPMQRVLPAPAKPARRGSVPVWAGPLLGAALVLGAFGAVKVVRGEASRTRAEQVSTVPTASASATAPTATAEPVVSATAEPVVSATAAPVVSAKPPKRPQVQPSKRKPTVQDILGAEPSYWHENPSPAGGSKPRF
jgi:LmbE family N-acetylglucosaminyl deacetylase